MAYDEQLAERVRAALDERTPYAEIKMFGGLCFTVNGNMALGVVNSDLMVRVGAETHEKALSRPGARPMDFTKSPMKGFLFVDEQGWKTAAGMKRWVDLSLAYVETLPPKKPKPRRTSAPRASAKRAR